MTILNGQRSMLRYIGLPVNAGYVIEIAATIAGLVRDDKELPDLVTI